MAVSPVDDEADDGDREQNEEDDGDDDGGRHGVIAVVEDAVLRLEQVLALDILRSGASTHTETVVTAAQCTWTDRELLRLYTASRQTGTVDTVIQRTWTYRDSCYGCPMHIDIQGQLLWMHNAHGHTGTVVTVIQRTWTYRDS